MPENAPTTPTAPTLNEQEKKSDRIYRFIISALCFAMCTVQIVNVIYPFFISSEFFVIHFMFGMLMCYLVYDYKGKKRYFYSPAKIFDIILALGVAAVAIYILRDIDAFLLRMDLVASPTDIVMGAICTVIVLEGCRRLTGPSLPAIALITILYALFGKYLPGLIGHKGYSFTRVIKTIFSQQGIFGMPIGVSANTVFLFLLFGAFLKCARLIKKQREVFGSGYRKKPQNMTRTAALRFRNTQKRSRANKNRIQPTGTPRTRNVSPGRFLFENLSFSQVKSRRK